MQSICDLVGSREVIKLLQRFKETNPIEDKVHPERPRVIMDLKNAMRKDLGVSLETD